MNASSNPTTKGLRTARGTFSVTCCMGKAFSTVDLSAQDMRTAGPAPIVISLPECRNAPGLVAQASRQSSSDLPGSRPFSKRCGELPPHITLTPGNMRNSMSARHSLPSGVMSILATPRPNISRNIVRRSRSGKSAVENRSADDVLISMERSPSFASARFSATRSETGCGCKIALALAGNVPANARAIVKDRCPVTIAAGRSPSGPRRISPARCGARGFSRRRAFRRRRGGRTG